MKMCLLKGYNLLGIDSGSYSFRNFFSTSSLLYFLEAQETCGSLPKFLFISQFSLLNSKKVQELSHTNDSNNNTEQFLHLVTFSQHFISQHKKSVDLL